MLPLSHGVEERKPGKETGRGEGRKSADRRSKDEPRSSSDLLDPTSPARSRQAGTAARKEKKGTEEKVDVRPDGLTGENHAMLDAPQKLELPSKRRREGLGCRGRTQDLWADHVKGEVVFGSTC